jgi:RNA polymerase sigma-70 factor (ECF subfamily)
MDLLRSITPMKLFDVRNDSKVSPGLEAATELIGGSMDVTVLDGQFQGLDGEQAALLDAWVHYRGRLHALCLRWVGGDADDAADVLSQVALRAVEEHAEQATVISNYRGWLTRLAWNLCMDLHREKALRFRTLERFALHSRIDVAARETHAEAEYLGRELGARILRAIDGLPPRLREPCRRRFLDDAPYELIAEELGLTNETVRKRIQEARDILYERLGPYLRGGSAARPESRKAAARRAAPHGVSPEGRRGRRRAAP